MNLRTFSSSSTKPHTFPTDEDGVRLRRESLSLGQTSVRMPQKLPASGLTLY